MSLTKSISHLILMGLFLSGCNQANISPTTPPEKVNTPVHLSPTATNVSVEAMAAPIATEIPIISETPTSSFSIISQAILDQGKTLAESVCIVCHPFDRISSSHMTEAQWTITVSRMVEHGAPLDQAQQQAVIAYLSATYK